MGNVHPNPGPIRNNPRPWYPCSICHLDVGRNYLQCTTCLKCVHFHCSSLTRADFRTICATGTAVCWRCSACYHLSKTRPLTQTNSPITSRVSPPLSPPGFPSLTPGCYQPRPPQGPPRNPCSLCSHEVGKDSPKCSTCSKWVHFSCSFLTRQTLVQTLGCGPTFGSPRSSSTPPSLERGRVVPPPEVSLQFSVATQLLTFLCRVLFFAKINKTMTMRVCLRNVS